eukprot:TRINITY_DN9290_c0_g1_i1.p1 TRINITY_DN9290_c0_g1~~TRINITY_DN9290_c0_g1_i1.p1  ORF type:complete len:408 (+),score=118.31 TRINITY_DN9290_c0_g1_i1:51-1274(+)
MESVVAQSPAGCSHAKIKALKAAWQAGLLSEDTPLAIFYNLSHYRREIQKLIGAFPSHFVHTMAVKANPVLRCLEFASELGLGFESASLGELVQSLKAAPASRCVFDSPAKTRAELKLALERGVYVNLDNFQELDRVTEMVASNSYETLNVGLRINPQIGFGAIKEFSTAGAVSKFGIPLEYRDDIIAAFRSRPWLNGVHVHVGSQGMTPDAMLDGIRHTVALALEVNAAVGRAQISYVDIGGGLSVNFDDERDETPTAISFQDFAGQLKEAVPALFDGSFKAVFTEFGRRLNAKPGFIVSRVEYAKVSGGRNIGIVHAGADLFVRTVWMPSKWPIRVSVVTPDGDLKQGTPEKQDIAGPCCFGGDIIAHERELPRIAQNDWIIAHDTGAYYYSSWCYYNSRQAPAI